MPTLTQITIPNGNFASPVFDGYGWGQVPTNWTRTGSADTMGIRATFPDTRVGDQYVSFQNGNTLSQTNIATIEANTTYVLCAHAASDSTGTFVIELTANGVVVASYEDFPGSPYIWPRYSVEWQHINTHTGQQLGILLRCTTNYATSSPMSIAYGNLSLCKYDAPVVDWLRHYLDGMAEGEAKILRGWQDSKVVGAYSPTRAPDDSYVTYPQTVFSPWPGAIWDERTGQYYVSGRGHATGGANDITRWSAATNKWERLFLPSGQESQGDPNGWTRVKGGFNTGGPLGSHALNSFNLLQLSRRTIFYGGGTFNSGNFLFKTWNGTTYENEGPFLYDITKVDRFKVGGPTGSGRIGTDAGLAAWTNRRKTGTSPFTWPYYQAFQCAVVENSRDVVYTYCPSGAVSYVVRHEIVDINDPSLDIITQITPDAGSFWYGDCFGASCFIRDRRVIVFVGASYSAEPANDKYIAYVDLNAGSPTLLRPSVSSNLSCPGGPSACYDEVRKRIVVIGGPSGADATLRTFSVPDVLTNTWDVAALTFTGDAPRSNDQTACSIFKYSRKYDCYLMPTKENVTSPATLKNEMWIYKPVGWSPLPQAAPQRRMMLG